MNNSIFQNIKKSKLMQSLTSTKITTILLLCLCNIIFWGTIDQTERGLWAAQNKYFYAWLYRAEIPYTQAKLWFPLPGMLLVGWLMCIQQILCFIFKFKYLWAKTGILIMHFGLLMMLVGGGVSFYFSKEAQLTLAVNEKSQFALGYHSWEISIWKNSSLSRQVSAITISNLQAKDVISVPNHGIEIEIESNYLNALAYAEQEGLKMPNLINSSHIAMLKETPLEKEPEQNVPGIIFNLKNEQQRVLLYGAEQAPTPYILANKDTLFFQLRRERFPLPFEVTLLEFKRLLHGGTMMARAFESKIQVQNNTLNQEYKVAMNEPYRF